MLSIHDFAEFDLNHFLIFYMTVICPATDPLPLLHDRDVVQVYVMFAHYFMCLYCFAMHCILW